MSGNIRWTRVNNSLTLSHRMASGYEYRIRESGIGTAVLIAESGSKPTRRQECTSVTAAFRLADDWERES